MRFSTLVAVFLTSEVLACSGAVAQDLLPQIDPETGKSSATLTLGPIHLTVDVALDRIESNSLKSPNDASQLTKDIKKRIEDLNTQSLKQESAFVDSRPQVKGNVRVSVTGPPEILLSIVAQDKANMQALYDFDVSADPNELARVNPCVTITIYRPDGTATILAEPEPVKPAKSNTQRQQTDAHGSHSTITCKQAIRNPVVHWHLSYDEPPIALVEVDGRLDKGDRCKSQFGESALFSQTCRALYVIARREDTKRQLILGMEVIGGEDSPLLSITQNLLMDSQSLYSVNGDNRIKGRSESWIPAPDGTWGIEWQRVTKGCRAASADENAYAILMLKAPAPMWTQVSNGIVVSAAKVFDVVTLQKMLNTTASQLSAISGFNSNAITGALGNLQGISRETSYLAGQVTTTPLPTISATSASSLGTNTASAQSQTLPGQSTTTVTLQCPDGSLPSIGTGNQQGCSVPTTALPASSGSTSTLTTNTGATTPTTSTTQSTGGTTGQQNSVTTTTQGVGGVAPTTPSLSPLSAPGNVGVASTDILAEQVQLNSQITTLRLLLQGALSDQYLLKNSTAVGERQQTTLGLTVALDPPRQFKHSVAEVRVIIIPTGRSDGPSIMNLLPAEKTYNVARVTSSLKSFGGGAVVEPVSFGITTGKSKDRLYLAKDTDTLALQFPLPLTSGHSERVETPLPQRVHDIIKSALEFQTLGGCAWNAAYEKTHGELEQELEQDVTRALLLGSKPIAFGWQFRPVLGAEYVAGGERQVFAQLALGAGLGQSYVPHVYVETRWREYNSHGQAVGEVYKGSCSLTEQAGGVAVLSQPRVRDVVVSDLGAGQLKLTATGNFYTSSISVLSGQNVLSSVFFDGRTIEVFGNANSLIGGGDLKIIGQNGQNAPFAIATPPNMTQYRTCGISNATLIAKPRPDGNSLVDVNVTLGPQYQADGDDGQPRPFVLIGNQVFGLRESPFINDQDTQCGASHPLTCNFQFLAPTINLRNAQTFFVRDIAWDNMQMAGRIEFFPTFTGAVALAPSPPVITTQPADQAVSLGQKAAFSVAASSATQIVYQWRKNGVAIKEASSSHYTTEVARLSDSGELFDVVLSNSAGNVTSTVAKLNVNTKPASDQTIDARPATTPADTNTKSTAAYEISGYDFTQIAVPCVTSGAPLKKPCLRVFADSNTSEQPEFSVVSDNLIILNGVQAGAKSLRFQLYWGVTSDPPGAGSSRIQAVPDPAKTIEWDLTVPKTSEESPASIVGTPAFLYMGDSQTISFSSPNFANFANSNDPIVVTFDGAPISGVKYDSKKKTLNVPITTTITKVPGHKELTVTLPSSQGGGAPQPATLTFDVVKQIIKE